MLDRLILRLQANNKRRSARARRERYLRGGRLPLTEGYWEYRNDFIQSVICDSALLAHFARLQDLPPSYGIRLDERVVEYPWVVARLSDREGYLLDAGSTLNYAFVLDLPIMNRKKIVICTLAPEENVFARGNVSYIYGDLRQTILRDDLFDEIVCISTLEHVGMDNTQIYVREQRYNESNPLAYREAMLEFRRLLAPGGRLLLTVPYGKYANHGWLQQFDRAHLDHAIQAFGGAVKDETFFRYTPEGWVLADAKTCATCEYRNFLAQSAYDPDFAAAARAVACIELTKQ